MQILKKMRIFAREINKLNNNMKRFFISAIVTMSCFMANAQEITIPAVDLAPGCEKTVNVSLANANNYTAFQFDIALPSGVTVKKADLENKASTRKIETGTVNGKFRVLSYDENNKKFTSGSVLSLTFAATDDTDIDETEAEVSTIVVVKDDGTGEGETTGTVAINVSNEETISIGSSGMTSYICDYGLDFTGKEEKAYIVSGIVGDNVLLTRIYKVPAETPIVVKGSEGDHILPRTKVTGLYYKSFLIGNNTDAAINVTPEGDDQFLRVTTKGFARFTDKKSVGAHKAYIRAGAKPAANAGSDWSLSIGSGKRTSLCANVDLDFSNVANLKAYIATGYNNGSVLISSVKKVSAGTPLYIKGPQGDYTIPSAAVEAVYANSMVGNNSENTITINPTDGDYTNLFVGTSGFAKFTGTKNISKHKSYAQVLTSYYSPATSRGSSDGDDIIDETELETLSIPISSFDDDDETTSIRSIDSQLTNDIWYNLSGQRIDTPTKKGLYIKNGKKVVVK